MLFKDLPVVSMKDALKAVSAAKGIVFVSAKGIDGIKMPLKEAREAVTKSMVSEVAFVPVTDSWKSPKDVLAKDFALQLKQDTKSPYPLILSVAKDRYEKFAENELNPAFEGNALVVLQPAPTDKKLAEVRAFHHKTREIIGEGKEPRIFTEHVMTVTEIAKKFPKTPKVFIDAGGGFMIFDQAKHYLDTGIVGEVVALNVTLAKSEKMTIPYLYDNADHMGAVKEAKALKVVQRGPGRAPPAPAAGPDADADTDADADAEFDDNKIQTNASKVSKSASRTSKAKMSKPGKR